MEAMGWSHCTCQKRLAKFRKCQTVNSYAGLSIHEKAREMEGRPRMVFLFISRRKKKRIFFVSKLVQTVKKSYLVGLYSKKVLLKSSASKSQTANQISRLNLRDVYFPIKRCFGIFQLFSQANKCIDMCWYFFFVMTGDRSARILDYFNWWPREK